MINRLIIKCRIMIFLFTLLITGISWGEQNPVKIGVLAIRGADQCMEKWSPTAEYLSGKIPDRTFVIIPLDHKQIHPFIERGEVDFILANSSFYVELEHLYEANRIATLKNQCLDDFCTKYCGVIFWKADRSDIRQPIDLKGKTFMAVAESSFGGWMMAWRELKETGIDPYSDFKDLEFGGTEDSVVYAVRDGRADAGTVRADTFIRMHDEGKINLQNFYVVHEHGGEGVHLPFPHSTRGYPEWPMAKVKHTPDELAEKVATALIEMPVNSPAAIAAKCGGWTIPMNYQSVHECLKYLKVGCYKDPGKITIADVIRNYRHWILLAAVLFLVMTGFSIAILILNRNIKASHIRLQAEVSERKLSEKELIKSKEVAEAASRAKGEFLANMNHEILTPMNGVIAAADLALSEKMSPRAEHYLKTVQSSAYSLLGIINDILDLSKIKADKIDIEMHPFLLDDVIDRVIDVFINKAAEKRIELLVDIALETPNALIGAPLRLQQILKNLVGNAIKFTKRGGAVLIGVKESERSAGWTTLTFVVKDTGIGIAPEYLPGLFKPFSQADTSSTREYEGTGLGLSICKRLVEMMGGEIRVESELGKGSAFHFTVRFGRQPSDQRRRFIPHPDIQHLNVLVADDCVDSRLIMQKMLESFGLRVKPVFSGEELLKTLKENETRKEPFELVIIDWMMSGLSGIETSKRIRRDLKLTIPIILMTASGKETEMLDAEKAGINAFLTKPIHPSTLFNAIMDTFWKKALRIEKKKYITTRASIYKNFLRGIRILMAEDNPTNQEVALAILEGAGIVVEIAKNGKHAVEAVQRSHFDVVLMDIQMPEMDGYEATRLIRKELKFKSLPIIAMTAHAMKADEEKCLKAGMDSYISKPVNQDRLFHTIWKLMKYRKRQPYYRKPEAPAQVITILKQLAHALNLADPEEIEKHMKVVKKYLDISILQDIEDQVNNYEYGRALEILKWIMEEMEGRKEVNQC